MNELRQFGELLFAEPKKTGEDSAKDGEDSAKTGEDSAKDGKGVVEDDGIRREYVAQMCRFLEDRQIEQTPLLLIQMQDVLAQLLVSRQIDGALNSGGALGTKLQAAGDGRSRALTLVEAAGKSRERLRRAMKDLSDATKTAGSPAHQSLAEVMKPILKKAQGALEEALGQDARKKTKRRARPKKNEA